MTDYQVYPKFIELALTGMTIRGMLLTASASFNAGHDYVADVVANEVSASGYVRQTIVGTFSSDADGAYFSPSASYVDFPVATYDFRYLAIYVDAADDASRKLVGLIDFGETISVVARKLRVTFSGDLIEAIV